MASMPLLSSRGPRGRIVMKRGVVFAERGLWDNSKMAVMRVVFVSLCINYGVYNFGVVQDSTILPDGTWSVFSAEA